jgi:hypothetical protein
MHFGGAMFFTDYSISAVPLQQRVCIPSVPRRQSRSQVGVAQDGAGQVRVAQVARFRLVPLLRAPTLLDPAQLLEPLGDALRRPRPTA